MKSEVLYCRNPRRDGRRRTRARLAIRRRSTRGSAVRVDRRRLDRSRRSKVGIPAFVRPERRRDCRDLPTVSRRDRRKAFAAFFRRFGPKYPFIPNGLRFDLSTAFRRGASDSSRRRPDRRTSRVSSQTFAFENVEKRLKTRRGRLQLASLRRLATEDEKADGWTSTRRPAKP